MAGRTVYPDPYNQQYQTRNDPLPAGWEMLFDKQTGWPYFVDHNTQQTSWQDPRIRMASMGYPHHQSFDASHGHAGHGSSFQNHGKPIEIPVVHESSQAPPTRQVPHQTNTWQGPSQTQPYPHPQPQPQVQNTYPQGGSATMPMHHGHQAHIQQPQGRESLGVREIPVQHLSINETRPRQPASHDSQVHPQQGLSQTQGYPQTQSGYPGYPAQSQGYPQPTQGYPPQPAREGPTTHAAPSQPHPPPSRDNEPIVIPIIHENSKPEAQIQSNHHCPRQTHYSSGPTVNEQTQSPRSNPQQPTGGQQSPTSTPPPPRQPEKSDEERAFDIINGVVNDVKNLEASVNIFNGKKTEKEYRYLEEMLTRSLIKLDAVQAGGHEKIRESRRNAVKLISAALDLLELKACANQQQIRNAATTRAYPTNVDRSSTPRLTSRMDSERCKSTETPSETGSQSSDSSKKKGPSGSPGHVREMVLESEINC